MQWQEPGVTIVRILPALKDVERFGPRMWSITPNGCWFGLATIVLPRHAEKGFPQRSRGRVWRPNMPLLQPGPSRPNAKDTNDKAQFAEDKKATQQEKDVSRRLGVSKS